MSRPTILVVCPDCKRERLVSKDKLNRKGFTGRCQVCNGFSKRREGHPQWKGGVTKRGDGYVEVLLEVDSPFYSMVHRATHRVMEHRLVLAQHLGRCLSKEEIVHHLNGDRADNRRENLCLTNSKQHDRQSFVKQLQRRIEELERRTV